MADLEERILEEGELQPRICAGILRIYIFLGTWREDSLKHIIETLNAFHLTKFTAKWSR